ncbi:MAG TPA: hypothetical protein VHY84_25250 [Bryobacteraceae bacterium]|jgi:hypothetical protein|nr:hypothetical protein [Bryobacteraceae bacterium]
MPRIPGNLEPLRKGCGSPFALVHQDRVRVHRKGECDGRLFTSAEGLKFSIVDQINRYDLQPCRVRGDPFPTHRRRRGMMQFPCTLRRE